VSVVVGGLCNNCTHLCKRGTKTRQQLETTSCTLLHLVPFFLLTLYEGDGLRPVPSKKQKMGHINAFLFFSTIVLCLLAAPSLIFAVPSVTNNRLPSPPYQIPQFPQQLSINRRPWSRIRDQIIRIIWRISERQQDAVGSGKVDILTNVPAPKLLARYGGDVVLRFEIHTAEEAKALAEAATVLFLDVWEFTKEWADVRLAKEIVSSTSIETVQAPRAYGIDIRSHHCLDFYHLLYGMLILL